LFVKGPRRVDNRYAAVATEQCQICDFVEGFDLFFAVIPTSEIACGVASVIDFIAAFGAKIPRSGGLSCENPAIPRARVTPRG